jgi:hypothetical protein
MPFPYVIKIGRALGGKCSTVLFHTRGDSFNTSDEKVDKTILALGYRLVRLRQNTYFSIVHLHALTSHRTLLPIQYPPHTIALGSIYVAALLSSFEQPASPSREGFRTSEDIASTLRKRGGWEKKFQSQVEDLEGASSRSCLTFPNVKVYRYRTHPPRSIDSMCAESVGKHISQHSLFAISSSVWSHAITESSPCSSTYSLQSRSADSTENCHA